MNRRRRRGSSAEGGAAATIVAVLAATGVLLGGLAISVDIGRVMLERSELQNAADAGALAAAQTCAEDPDFCSEDLLRADISDLVNRNARDFDPSNESGGHEIDQICGPLVGEGCPAASLTDLAVCPPLPDGFLGDYVEVHTLTKSGDQSVISNFFGGAIGGASDSTVAACARAAWGSPESTGGTFPLTISLCNWERTTNNGTSYAPSPPYDGYPDGGPTSPRPPVVEPFVTSVNAHVPGNPDDYCGPTKYAPGGFGWLKDAGGCTAVFSAIGTVPGGTGSSPDGSCKDDMQKYLGTEVLIPVFSKVSGSGSGTTFTLAGISSFYLAGWQDIPSAKPKKTHSVYRMPTPGPRPAPAPGFCYEGGKDANCIWGWFTSPLLPIGAVSNTAPDRGPKVIQLVG